jgi:oxygen-independent coproporphyrinogen-3 oxidase
MPGVYVSYPFCDQKCTYCNFGSGVLPRQIESGYLDALAAELRAHQWQWPPETVYLGGGTPSRLDAASLGRILDAVPGRPWREATIEAAPGGFTLEAARRWADLGITRVSLGVQSFAARELAQTGRRHAAEIVAADIGALRKVGLGNFNVDLIAGLPHQTVASWSDSLDWVARLEAPHVSVYMLEVDGDSRLGAEALAGGSRYGVTALPSEDQTAGFYETAVDRLAAMGLARYEISNFARPGFESRHNLKYWTRQPYAGFGADAHSFDGTIRKRNAESAREYIDRMAAHGEACVEETPARDDERFFLGLRLDAGVRPDPSEWRRFEAPIRRFLDGGLLVREGEALRLSRRGVLLSNEVFQEFVIS